MSRSHKHTPICGMCVASSEKFDKQKANRRTRRLVRETLGREVAPEVIPLLREVSDVWTFIKDGKHWFDFRRYPKEMRK